MMINPLQLMQMAQASNNPMAMINQMAGGDPVMQRALMMADGKDEAALKQMVKRLAHEKGMNDQQLAGFLGNFGLRL